MTLTIILSLVITYLTINYITLRQRMKHHQIVSNLAQSRRDLIWLTHEGKINTDSATFKIIYMTCEFLIKIRYWKLLHLLPSPGELLAARKFEKKEHQLSQQFKSELQIFKSENDEEIDRFLVSYFNAISNAFIKNQIWLLINLLGRIGVAKFSKSISSLVSARKDVEEFIDSAHYCPS